MLGTKYPSSSICCLAGKIIYRPLVSTGILNIFVNNLDADFAGDCRVRSCREFYRVQLPEVFLWYGFAYDLVVVQYYSSAARQHSDSRRLEALQLVVQREIKPVLRDFFHVSDNRSLDLVNSRRPEYKSRRRDLDLEQAFVVLVNRYY